MNNWIRNENIEDSFESLHKYKVNVYTLSPQIRGVQKTKLSKDSKEVFLTETLEKGLTRECILEYNGQTYRFDRVYDAEVKAVEIFKGE